MRAITTLAVTAAVLGSVSLAQAGSFGRPCTTVSQDQWQTLDALQRKVEEAGFKVQKAKLKNSCGEFYATDQTGARVELFVDPATGAIVGRL